MEANVVKVNNNNKLWLTPILFSELMMISEEKKLLHFPSGQTAAREIFKPQCNVIEVLPLDIRQRLEALLEKYRHMIADGYKLRCVSKGELNIILKEDKAIRYQSYRLSLSQREEVRKIIDDLLDNNIIRESVSPFASPIVLIPKATVTNLLTSMVSKAAEWPSELNKIGESLNTTKQSSTGFFYRVVCSLE
jgi:hypothetical protein